MTLEEMESRLGRLRIAEAPPSFVPRAVAHAAAMGRLQRGVRRSLVALAASLALAVGGSSVASSLDARRTSAPAAESGAVACPRDPVDEAAAARARLARLFPSSSGLLEKVIRIRAELGGALKEN